LFALFEVVIIDVNVGLEDDFFLPSPDDHVCACSISDQYQ
jgi:hypothetical protein